MGYRSHHGRWAWLGRSCEWWSERPLWLRQGASSTPPPNSRSDFVRISAESPPQIQTASGSRRRTTCASLSVAICTLPKPPMSPPFLLLLLLPPPSLCFAPLRSGLASAGFRAGFGLWTGWVRLIWLGTQVEAQPYRHYAFSNFGADQTSQMAVTCEITVKCKLAKKLTTRLK